MCCCYLGVFEVFSSIHVLEESCEETSRRRAEVCYQLEHEQPPLNGMRARYREQAPLGRFHLVTLQRPMRPERVSARRTIFRPYGRCQQRVPPFLSLSFSWSHLKCCGPLDFFQQIYRFSECELFLIIT